MARLRAELLSSRVAREAHYFLPFACVGVAGFLLDSGLLAGLIWLTEPQTSVQIFLLRCLGFSCAVVCTWVLNKSWTFRYHQSHGKLPLYYLLMVIGGGINLGVFTACILWVPLCTRYPVLAIIPGTATAMLVNFCSMRFLVFTEISGADDSRA